MPPINKKMKYIKQILIITGFSLAGEALARVIPFPIPAAIYGFVLLFLALLSGALKPAHIEETANFLIGTMSILFVAPAVSILAHFGILAPKLASIAAIVCVSTFVVFAVAGLVTQLLRRRKGEENG